jgi:hypothetical protein
MQGSIGLIALEGSISFNFKSDSGTRTGQPTAVEPFLALLQ